MIDWAILLVKVCLIPTTLVTCSSSVTSLFTSCSDEKADVEVARRVITRYCGFNDKLIALDSLDLSILHPILMLIYGNDIIFVRFSMMRDAYRTTHCLFLLDSFLYCLQNLSFPNH
nr:Cell division protein [Moritella viscosa]SHO17341.1 Cell division protein [Moritella viscosa]